MTILDYYSIKHNDNEWTRNYATAAKNKNGYIFSFLNTNYRTTETFKTNFINFLDYINVNRNEWERNENHGQETAKQWIVNLRQSKLYYLSNGVYNLSFKGHVFNDLIHQEFTNEEQWLLTYILLNNSYFNLVPNYIFVNTDRILKNLIDLGYKKDYILSLVKEFLLLKSVRTKELPKFDIFWLLTFNNEKDFITLFKNSTMEEISDLKNSVLDNIKDEIFDISIDCISYKLKGGGIYTKNTFIDECKLFYFSAILLDANVNSFDAYLKILINSYKELFDVNENCIFEFCKNNLNVFDVVFRETFGNNEEDIENNNEDDLKVEEENVKLENELVDTTSSENDVKIHHVSMVLKRLAKESNKYKCSLHDLNNCSYFTSKDNGKNYLEIHHLVPREFTNEFDKSIEIIENYVALCPHCHRLLHFGADRERKQALTYLFNQRKQLLDNKGIILDLTSFLQYYGVED